MISVSVPTISFLKIHQVRMNVSTNFYLSIYIYATTSDAYEIGGRDCYKDVKDEKSSAVCCRQTE
jgi:hypothetical protein